MARVVSFNLQFGVSLFFHFSQKTAHLSQGSHQCGSKLYGRGFRAGSITADGDVNSLFLEDVTCSISIWNDITEASIDAGARYVARRKSKAHENS